MDTDRRAEVAAVGRTLLDDLHEEIVISWTDLWPASNSWPPEATARARVAGRTALEALLTVFEQGDLDEPALERMRAHVLAATSTLDEADELFRTVRMIGVGRLSDLLAERIGLSHEERWELQREAGMLNPELVGRREAFEVGAIDALLADLENSGADLR